MNMFSCFYKYIQTALIKYPPNPIDNIYEIINKIYPVC